MSEEKKTLEDGDIVSERSMGRRSTIGAIGAAVAGAAGIIALTPETAEAKCTDSDGGRWADPGGRGRRSSPAHWQQDALLRAFWRFRPRSRAGRP